MKLYSFFTAGVVLLSSYFLISCNSGGGSSQQENGFIFLDEFSPITVDDLTLDLVDQNAGSLVSFTFNATQGFTELGSRSEGGSFTYSNTSTTDSFSNTFVGGTYSYRQTSSGRGRIIILGGQGDGATLNSAGVTPVGDPPGIPSGTPFLGDSFVAPGAGNTDVGANNFNSNPLRPFDPNSDPDGSFFSFNLPAAETLPALVIDVSFAPSSGGTVEVVNASYRRPITFSEPDSGTDITTFASISFNGRGVPARYAGTLFDPSGGIIRGNPVYNPILPLTLQNQNITFEGVPGGDLTFSLIRSSIEVFNESGLLADPTGVGAGGGVYLYQRDPDGAATADFNIISTAGTQGEVVLTFLTATSGTYTSAGTVADGGSTFKLFATGTLD